MNNLSNKTEPRGILLTDNVDREWLDSITPVYFEDFIKFIVNKESNEVVVGMEVHKNGVALMRDSNPKNVLGGNLYPDNSIVYSSTLNVMHNAKLDNPNRDDMRIILDSDLQKLIDSILFSWIKVN